MRSIDFVKARLESGLLVFCDGGPDKIVEYRLGALMALPLPGPILGTHPSPVLPQTQVTVTYADDAEWQYCTCVSSVHDGTLLFVHEGLAAAVGSVWFGGSYNVGLAPEDFLSERSKYDVSYTIGDPVVLLKFGTYEINGTRMAGEEQMVCIPVIWSCKKQD